MQKISTNFPRTIIMSSVALPKAIFYRVVGKYCIFNVVDRSYYLFLCTNMLAEDYLKFLRNPAGGQRSRKQLSR